jgi:hypothetical protein
MEPTAGCELGELGSAGTFDAGAQNRHGCKIDLMALIERCTVCDSAACRKAESEP